MEKKTIWKKHCESLNLLSLGEVLRTMTFIPYLLQQTDPSLRKKPIVCGQACVLSRVWFFTPLLTVAQQVPLSMGFSRQEYWGWVAISSPRGSFQPKNQTCVSCISCLGRWILYHWATWEDQKSRRAEAKIFNLHLQPYFSILAWWIPGWRSLVSYRL